MRPWPETLLVRHDLDTVCVTLGPSQRITAWEGLAGIFASMAGGGTLAAGGQMFVGGVVAVLGVTAGGVVRMRGWVREEAPLELWIRPGGLEIRRVYRQRLLHSESVGFDALRGCSVVSRGLVLDYASGRSRRLVTGFRSEQELDWVAEVVHERITRCNVGEADPRLERLREGTLEASIRPS
jgi:hypothetical protein